MAAMKVICALQPNPSRWALPLLRGKLYYMQRMFSPDKDANRRTCVLIESERDCTLGPNGNFQDKDTKRSFILLIVNDDIYVPFCLLVVF
jgi:hypothetical protein